MNVIWKITLVFLLAIGGIISVSFNVNAAGKPYEYTFDKDSEYFKFNEISSINQLVITFDKDITASASQIFTRSVLAGNPLYVVAKGGKERLNIVKSVAIPQNNKLIVRFENLDYFDFKRFEDLELVIDKDTLRFDQLEEYRIPFKSYELLPGLKSTFLDTQADIINENIFKQNAPRDVSVHVPDIFIQAIETIHLQQLVPDHPIEDEDITKDPENDKRRKDPSLTNIDIVTTDQVSRLKATFDDEDEYSRDLIYRKDISGFTMGQAGLAALPGGQPSDEFKLRAFDAYGKFLEERKFKLKAVDSSADEFLINDYIPEFEQKNFGQTVTLYDLMQDQEVLESILRQIPVSQLDSLGITYAVADNSVSVKNENELLMALANDKIAEITLLGDISLATSLKIERDVTINGSSSQFELKGEVLVGTGDDITARLNGIDIVGDLTIDVGQDGTAVLDQVTAPKTTVLSGGSTGAVYLNAFLTNELIISSTSPVRMFVNGDTKINDQSNDGINQVNITVATTQPVILEGVYERVTIDETTMLVGNKNTVINKLIVQPGEQLEVNGSGFVITSAQGDIIFPGGKTTGTFTKTWSYSQLTETVDNWNSLGRFISFFGVLLEDAQGNQLFPQDFTWSVKHNFNDAINANISWNGPGNDLFIDGVQVMTGKTRSGEVTLTGVYTPPLPEKIKTEYVITVPVVLTN
ncbi:hypothetical protein [Domibacillus mangrovi]|uniref:Uncharacterized protein n=1 Tax=Domibacillus mangrovi TaxID=1714354 RepID=A0A1Q5P619_9BACI|nr:hypothetical protein [Domibacillus mangrovi]OKL37643.1 hypothetical protein BLL40_04910 [Domibacillus mangrovi]